MNNNADHRPPVVERHVLDYITLARPQYWWKNCLVLVGFGLAELQQSGPAWNGVCFSLGLALLATCLLASSNYVLNEILDSHSDQFHPEKHQRSLATGRVNRTLAYAQWIGLICFGLVISVSINRQFFMLSVAFVIAGLCYNVLPMRLKDWPVIDVVSEAINSPIRVLLGWSILLPVQEMSPAILFAFWFAGMSLMAKKRLEELKQFETQQLAENYRKSFGWYTHERLRILQVVSALVTIACLVFQLALS